MMSKSLLRGSWHFWWVLLVSLQRGVIAGPSYLFQDVGRASSLLRTTSRSALLNQQRRLLAGGWQQRSPLQQQVYQRMLVRRKLLDFFDPLEPFEMAWEFYCNRYEIMDELMGKFVTFAKRNSIRAMTFMGASFLLAEVLARLGVFGERERLWELIHDSPTLQERLEDQSWKKTSHWLVDHGMNAMYHFRRFGGKSKFAIAVSIGGLFGKVVIQTTVTTVKVVMISFFVLETLSLLGFIGERGETILNWVDDHRDQTVIWMKKVARWHKMARNKLNFQWIENLYEAAVDEEKLATFGFSIGTVGGLLSM